MKFGFDVFETFNVTFEIYIEDKLINRQTMQAPKEMLMVNFIQTVDQISKDRRPMKLRMYRQEIIYDDFENKEKVLINEVMFGNNAMIAWEKTKEKKQ